MFGVPVPHVHLAGELELPIDAQVTGGLDYDVQGLLHLRGGLRDEKVSFGAGVSYRSITFDYARVDECDAALLASLPAPAWTFLHGPRSPVSSTAIRNGSKPSVNEA